MLSHHSCNFHFLNGLWYWIYFFILSLHAWILFGVMLIYKYLCMMDILKYIYNYLLTILTIPYRPFNEEIRNLETKSYGQRHTDKKQQNQVKNSGLRLTLCYFVYITLCWFFHLIILWSWIHCRDGRPKSWRKKTCCLFTMYL